MRVRMHDWCDLGHCSVDAIPRDRKPVLATVWRPTNMSCWGGSTVVDA